MEVRGETVVVDTGGGPEVVEDALGETGDGRLVLKVLCQVVSRRDNGRTGLVGQSVVTFLMLDVLEGVLMVGEAPVEIGVVTFVDSARHTDLTGN